MNKPNHVAVVGGGVIGALTTLTLLKAGMSVSWIGVTKQEHPDRVVALSQNSLNLLNSLGVLENIPSVARGQVKKMHICDIQKNTPLLFDAHRLNESELCEIVHAAPLLKAIEMALHSFLFSKIDAVYETHFQDETGVTVFIKGQDSVRAAYLIAADGANSAVRKEAGIETHYFDYERVALTATMQLMCPHEGVAYQYFLEEGPLALLPLTHPCQVSIVWSTTLSEANQQKNNSPAAFCEKLATRLPQHFADCILKSERLTFPLMGIQTKQCVAKRVILVGDAAHVVHPLAGLGLNLGLADVAALGRLFSNTGHVPNQNAVARYGRERQWETKRDLTAIHLIERAFHAPHGWRRKMGQLSLALGGIPILNRFLMKQGIGKVE